MGTKYLIFPMVLSDVDIDVLKYQSEQLRALNFEALNNLPPCKQSVSFHLSQAILDLKEVLNNRNYNGFRYNSYVLNMFCLKLDFVRELLLAKKTELFQDHIKVLTDSIITVKDMLCVNWELAEMEKLS